MNVTPGFVPCAKGAGGDILPHAFLGAPEEREFPIVNRARAVGGEMRDPSLFDKRIHDAVRAVLHEVCAIHEDDAGIALSRGGNFGSTTTNG